ncbi:GNAT family N-acetyltransferase [Neisseria perflava]|uniref:GNAT family N-acetyltransferase n=1 Tax=Neisseria perflava TaxID=33053 RepID=UPI00209D2F86|nr:GNAT family N-acetyltransferase [Neisseria perflava]MCP1659990.1 ribosomal protein S18 acetylase RimI-like enzyme [Neisseria perflava]
MSEMVIRPLVAADYQAWRGLWVACLDFYQTELDDSISLQTWHKLMAHPLLNGWGAFADNGAMLGFVHTVRHPNTWNTTDCCYLEDLFVAENARRQGVARRLIETVYAFAEAEGLNRVYWVTAADNQSAQALYRKMARQTDMVQFRRDFPAI